jgi:hypothetical protein
MSGKLQLLLHTNQLAPVNAPTCGSFMLLLRLLDVQLPGNSVHGAGAGAEAGGEEGRGAGPQRHHCSTAQHSTAQVHRLLISRAAATSTQPTVQSLSQAAWHMP